MNVVSVKGGKVHRIQTAIEGLRPFPICRTGARNHTGTQYKVTTREATCDACVNYYGAQNEAQQD
jgi:hypothetical protein